MAKVPINGQIGRTIVFLQGLLPLSFAALLHKLSCGRMPLSLNVSMYADNVALWLVNCRKESSATVVETSLEDVAK